jgi:hypothetical protein
MTKAIKVMRIRLAAPKAQTLDLTRASDLVALALTDLMGGRLSAAQDGLDRASVVLHGLLYKMSRRRSGGIEDRTAEDLPPRVVKRMLKAVEFDFEVPAGSSSERRRVATRAMLGALGKINAALRASTRGPRLRQGVRDQTARALEQVALALGCLSFTASLVSSR